MSYDDADLENPDPDVLGIAFYEVNADGTKTIREESSVLFETRLLTIISELEDLQSTAEDCGLKAVHDKIDENIGGLYNAYRAAYQYRVGILTTE